MAPVSLSERGRLTMTYEAHIVISLNWNIDKRVLLSKTFSFNTFNEACNFFEDRGIPLQDDLRQAGEQ